MTEQDLIEIVADTLTGFACGIRVSADCVPCPELTEDDKCKVAEETARSLLAKLAEAGVVRLAPENNDDPRTTLVAVDPLLPEDNP